MPKKISLQMLNESFSICKMPQFAELPKIFTKGEMCFIARTDGELSIICPEFMVPTNVQEEAGWKGMKVVGDNNLKEVGVLAALTQPLAEAGIPLIAVATFDTDYIFVMEENLVKAVQALQKTGHEFVHQEQ